METNQIETLKITVDGPSKTPPQLWENQTLFRPKNTLSCSHKTKYPLSKIEGHPVLIGYLKAFSDHLPMTISPDIMWQLILLGFAQHVDQNYELLRDNFVDFKGKKKLTVERLNLTLENAKKEDWEDIINEFVLKINENVSDDLVNILTPNFSTTNNINKTTAQISIMSSMKHYFDFECMICGCGIPYINLEGSLNDWKEIKKKTESLKKYKLNWWIDNLIPILDKIIKTKEGDIDINFWRDFINVNKKDITRYGPSGMRKWTEKVDVIKGWIIKFFPYDKRGYKNDLEEITFEKKKYICDPLCETPMTLILVARGISLNTVFKCGFIGIEQDKDTFAVKPVIGWYLVNETGKKNEEDLEDFYY